ncbi:MAG: DUF1549 domain-containing protein, partial [Pirellulales bacterium]
MNSHRQPPSYSLAVVLRCWSWLLLFCGVQLLAANSTAAADSVDSQQLMAERVDALLAEGWAEAGAQPAPAADDAEFLRRATLDLAGVIPRAAEVRAFLRDERPDKRQRLIEELLSRPTYARHMADLWRHMLLPGEADVQAAGGVIGFQNWLQEQFLANNRYDNIVADLLVARGNARQNGPALFYTALELKPEEIAANTSRILLGVQIQCAQCHDHPFDRWTKQDFWGYAAFFARLQRREGRSDLVQVLDANSGEVKFPDTDQTVPPKYLDAAAARPGEDSSRRRQLAIWLVSRDNPFFAKAAANRVWSILFGRGLVEPVDDFSERNPPSHPRLLQELADYLIESGYDLRVMFGMLCRTKAYQLSSQPALANEQPAAPELFASMAIKSLTPEQLYDSLSLVTRRAELQRGGVNRLADPTRMDFIARFNAPTQSAAEFQSGMPQALTLMNGRAVSGVTDVQQSPLLLSLDAPFLSHQDRVEALFLTTLSRLPTDEERQVFVAHV